MPSNGIKYQRRSDLLTADEIGRLVSVMASMGVSKVRLTGGEPFVRKDIDSIMETIINTPGIADVHITTNGTLTAPYVPLMKRLGVSGVNVSLDAATADAAKEISRRDSWHSTFKTVRGLVDAGISVKINCVVLAERNLQEIIPLTEMARHDAIDVRFIEEMPFNGSGKSVAAHWDHQAIRQILLAAHPDMKPIPSEPHSTALCFAIPYFRGKIGIIPAFSRTFCGSCNRIRITADGILKICLYDRGSIDLKSLLRGVTCDSALKTAIQTAVRGKARNGFDAAAPRADFASMESMATIGG